MVVAVAADVGERRVAGIDPGVDRADDDALAVDVRRQAELVHGVPEGVGVLPARARVGLQLALLVGRDRRHSWISSDGACLVGGEHGRHAVDGVLVGERDVDVATSGALEPLDELGLDLLQVTLVGTCRGAPWIQLLAGLRRGGCEAGLTTVVAGNGRIDQPDEVGDRTLRLAEHAQRRATLDAELGSGACRLEVRRPPRGRRRRTGRRRRRSGRRRRRLHRLVDGRRFDRCTDLWHRPGSLHRLLQSVGAGRRDAGHDGRKGGEHEDPRPMHCASRSVLSPVSGKP